MLEQGMSVTTTTIEVVLLQGDWMSILDQTLALHSPEHFLGYGSLNESLIESMWSNELVE
jgi:hypothetical protein